MTNVYMLYSELDFKLRHWSLLVKSYEPQRVFFFNSEIFLLLLLNNKYIQYRWSTPPFLIDLLITLSFFYEIRIKKWNKYLLINHKINLFVPNFLIKNGKGFFLSCFLNIIQIQSFLSGIWRGKLTNNWTTKFRYF